MLRVLAVAAVAGAFAPGVAVSEEHDVSSTAGSQAEVAVAVDPSNPNVLVAASNSVEPTSFFRSYTSVNGGRTWTTRLDIPNTAQGHLPCADPAPAIDGTGRQYIAFVACAIRPYVAVVTRTTTNEDWGIAARPLVDNNQQDKPAIAVDAVTSSPYAGRLYVGFFETSGDLLLLHSDDSGNSWSSPVTLARGIFTTLPQFLSLSVGSGGVLYAGWFTLDGFIFVTKSTDGGATFAPPRLVVRLAANRVGWHLPAQPQRGVTSNPEVVADPAGGQIYVSYSDLRRGHSDAFVVTLDDGLSPVRAPRAIAPKPKQAADRFLPSLAVDRTTGDVWDCFYATDGSRTLARVRYSCVVSEDGGATWSRPVRAASAFSSATQKKGGGTFNFGDYEGLAAAGGVAHPVWTDARDVRAHSLEIWTATLHAPGRP